MKHILLCIENDPQSERAEDYAIWLSLTTACLITALHVVDPFLKKFTHEIYAVNRDECRQYLDRELTAEGNIALARFLQKAHQANLNPTPETLLKNGDPEEIILTELSSNKYDLLIMGAKLLSNWKSRFESYKLSERIFRKSPVNMLFVR